MGLIRRQWKRAHAHKWLVMYLFWLVTRQKITTREINLSLIFMEPNFTKASPGDDGWRWEVTRERRRDESDWPGDAKHLFRVDSCLKKIDDLEQWKMPFWFLFMIEFWFIVPRILVKYKKLIQNKNGLYDKVKAVLSLLPQILISLLMQT